MTDIIQRDVVLAPLTTIKLGGPARFLVVCTSEADIHRALELAKKEAVPLHVLGGGSNTIFADEGFHGVVAKIELTGIAFQKEKDSVVVSVAAGEVWDEVVQVSIENGLAGIECLSGIPGLTGATPMQNVGAYGQEVAETIVQVSAIDRESGEHVVFSNNECAFGYRTSRFKKEDSNKYIITEVQFRLRSDGTPTIRYPQVQQKVAEIYGSSDLGSGPDALQKTRATVLRLRRSKSMVVDENDPHSRSCGSFFTNPIISSEQAGALAEKTGNKELGYATTGGTKLSAAWLVEEAGFTKGQRFGNIGISPNHSLALVNYGGTTKELLTTAQLIQKKIYDDFEIRVEIEPVAVPGTN